MDFKQLASNLGLEEDEFIELAELFVTTADSDLTRLENANNNKDPKEACEAAHSLKGSSGNLGFMDLSEIARDAELAARAKDLSKIDEYIASIKEKVDQIREKLPS